MFEWFQLRFLTQRFLVTMRGIESREDLIVEGY